MTQPLVEGTIPVEVVFALPEVQYVWNLRVSPQTTVRQAIVEVELAGLAGLQLSPDWADINHLSVGIWSKKVALETVLRARDRVEIYRPLVADPKVARRKKALAKRGA